MQPLKKRLEFRIKEGKKRIKRWGKGWCFYCTLVKSQGRSQLWGVSHHEAERVQSANTSTLQQGFHFALVQSVQNTQNTNCSDSCRKQENLDEKAEAQLHRVPTHKWSETTSLLGDGDLSGNDFFTDRPIMKLQGRCIKRCANPQTPGQTDLLCPLKWSQKQQENTCRAPNKAISAVTLLKSL